MLRSSTTPVLFIFIFILSVHAQVGTHAVTPFFQKKLITKFVQEIYAGTSRSPKIDFPENLHPWFVRANVDSFTVTYPKNRLPRGNCVLSLLAWHQGRVVQQKSITVFVHIFEPVLVITSAISAGDTLHVNVISTTVKETTTLKAAPIPVTQKEKVWIAKRFLPKGTILTEENVRRPYLITRGDSVVLLYQQGNIQIKLRVRALQNAYRGQRIWFLFPDTRKRLPGKVVSKTLALYNPKN